ncbi:MAG: helix-turn-helix domain-containing protein [Dysgonomonas sp.]|nr:helix-turn-helix domain-containing protein [Dysgonomonas sp.]
MAKYSDDLVKKIVAFVEEGLYTVADVCKMLGISRKSFYEWRDTKEEFKEALEAAKERCNERMLVMAKRSLQRKLEGYTLTETRTIYIPDENEPTGWKLKSKVVKEKEYAPDDKAIRFALERYEKKEDIVQNAEPVFSITVQNEVAKDLIGSLKNELEKRQKPEYSQKKKEDKIIDTPTIAVTENIASETETLQSDNQKKESKDEEKSEWVRDYNLPPGYLYRRRESWDK